MTEPQPQSMSKTALATMLGILGAAGIIAVIATGVSQQQQQSRAKAVKTCNDLVILFPADQDFNRCMAREGF